MARFRGLRCNLALPRPLHCLMRTGTTTFLRPLLVQRQACIFPSSVVHEYRRLVLCTKFNSNHLAHKLSSSQNLPLPEFCLHCATDNYKPAQLDSLSRRGVDICTVHLNSGEDGGKLENRVVLGFEACTRRKAVPFLLLSNSYTSCFSLL